MTHDAAAAAEHLLTQALRLYDLGGPLCPPDWEQAQDPDDWHGEVLASLADPANVAPDRWAAAARLHRLDNAAGIRALVRLSAASAVARALEHVLGRACACGCGAVVAPERSIDEICCTHPWLR